MKSEGEKTDDAYIPSNFGINGFSCRDSLFATMQCNMCIFLLPTGRRATGTEKDQLLKFFVRIVNLDAF